MASCGSDAGSRPFTAEEMADADKVPVLRAYLDKWGWSSAGFFPGITKDSSAR